MTDKLNFLEASFLIIVVVITHIILEFPNEIIKSTGSSAVLNIVYVTLQGACAGCPMKEFTLNEGIQRAIKEELPEIKEVRLVD